MGCWNWLLDDPLAEQINELALRLETKEVTGIPAVAADSYDNAPSGLLENLITFSNELKKAQEKSYLLV